MILSCTQQEADIADADHAVIHHAYIVACIDPYRISIACHCAVIAIEYIIGTSVWRIRPVCDKGLDDCIRIHRRLRILGNIICRGLDKRNDMLYSYFCILIMVEVPERMRLGAVKCCLSCRIILKDRSCITIDHCFDSIQISDRCIRRIIPAVKPVDNLISDIGISCLSLIYICRILKHFKLGNQSIHILCCHSIRVQLVLERCEHRRQVNRFLKRCYPAVHVLVHHVLGQFSERVGSLCLDCGIMIYIFKRIIPCQICFLFRLPYIPGIACVSENCHLARF